MGQVINAVSIVNDAGQLAGARGAGARYSQALDLIRLVIGLAVGVAFTLFLFGLSLEPGRRLKQWRRDHLSVPSLGALPHRVQTR